MPKAIRPSLSQFQHEIILRLALLEFGGKLAFDGNAITIAGKQKLHGIQTKVPGDISSAAFFLAAALLLEIRRFGWPGWTQPGRRGIVDLLMKMGASIEIIDPRREGGEPVGDLCAKSSESEGRKGCRSRCAPTHR